MVTGPGPSIRIASRGSQLALWQAEKIRTDLLAVHPTAPIDIVVVRTTGDRILDVPLARIGDRGLFTKEIDEELLEGRADIAVHSLKDVPTRLPEGLELAAVSKREDPRDVLLGRSQGDSLSSLPGGARIGTSSLRRRAQLGRLRPDLQVVDLRGNLNTRVARLDAGDYDAIILAAAGVVRLGWSERITELLEPESWLPAVGQGALAVVARAGDPLIETLRPLHDPATAFCVTAERAFLRTLEGGCQVPIGALARLEGDTVRLDGFVSDVEGRTILRDSVSGLASAAEELGVGLAKKLVERGAEQLLREVRAQVSPPGIAGP